jgi:hypothetical protein
MPKKTAFAISALLLGTALPALAAAPFGSFGGVVGGGNAGGGLQPVFGWALDDNGVQSVDILVDGVFVGRAVYGRGRPHIARDFPGFPDSNAAGFGFHVDTTRFLNGNHRVSALVTSRAGERRQLNTRVILFNNASHNLDPFGAITFPNHQAAMPGKCNPADPVRRWSIIEGYALDVGTQEEIDRKKGVGYVELLIDGAKMSNTKDACTFIAALGGRTNCYGLNSPGVTHMFPSVPNSDRARFRFAIDTGFLIDGLNYARGAHVITIRAADHYDNVENIAELIVDFSCIEDVPNEDSFGFVDEPPPGRIYFGTIQVGGWALDAQGIAGIQLLYNGAILPLTPVRGLPRAQVTSQYPGFPDSLAPGFRFTVDTTTLPNGKGTFEVYVVDLQNVAWLIGQREVTIFNP